MLTLNGTGMFRANGADLGKVTYQIVLDQRGTIKIASGSFAALPAMQRPAATARTVLRTDDDFEIVIAIKDLAANGSATFSVIGPVARGV